MANMGKSKANNLQIILASNSPRRKQLLRYFGFDFKVVKPEGIEELSSADSVAGAKRLVKRNALQKAQGIARSFPDSIVIGADTVVFCNNRIFGKPKDKRQASAFLYELSHTPHWVYTGLCLAYSGKRLLDVDATKVYMLPLSKGQVARYVSVEDNKDKSGGFAVQGLAGTFIYRIEGCFYNVMGMPLARLRTMLVKMGVRL